LIEEITGLRLVCPSSVDHATRQAGVQARTALDGEIAAIHDGRASLTAAAWSNQTTAYLMIDGTGTPMVPRDTAGRPGKADDGTSHTREAKIARFFTQTHCDQRGQPRIDPDSTSYTTTFNAVDQFIPAVAAEALRRDWHHAPRRAILGDGAKWIWGLADTIDPDAVQIVDYYHASQHLHDLADHLAAAVTNPDDTRQQLKNLLYHGRIATIIATIDALDLPTRHPELTHTIRQDLGYFITNHARMRYAHFRQQGFMIGTGAIESACKVLVEQRACLSGMRWTIQGADPVITLRALRRSPGREHLIWGNTPSHTTHNKAA